MQRSASFRVIVSFLLFAAFSASAAFKARLQGQSRDSTAWIGGNLKNWRDLNSVPARVYLTGGPVNNKTIAIEFDRLQGRNPAIDDLSDFIPSANVVITAGPTLAPSGTPGRWTYTLKVKVLDKKPGWITFYAHIADGAHLNGGSSVGMRGSPALGNLQIHKIAPAGDGGTTNSAPIADSDSYRGVENQPLIISAPGVLANDSDPDNDPLSATLVSGPANGTVSLGTDGGFVYTPNADFHGQDSFTYKASDGSADSSAATVLILLDPANQTPVAADDQYRTSMDATLVVPAPGVLANDIDADGDALTASIVTPPFHGIVTLNADGSLEYTPSRDFTGTDTFTYMATDGKIGSGPATVTIIIENILSNIPPTASLVHPTNGTIYIAGMDIPLVAEAADSDGTVASVGFLAHEAVLGDVAELPYALLLTNVPTGEYTFRATATDNAGATAISEPVNVTVLEHPPLAAGPFRLNRQTGLFEQTVTITNPTPNAFEGIRLWIMNVRGGATVWNATGTVEGVPYIEVTRPIPAAGTMTAIVEYYTPDMRVAPQPTFFPEVR